MPEELVEFLQSFECQAFIRLVLGGLLAGIIGYERQSWNKPAGLRTHILVGVSSVLIMLCGIYLADMTGQGDPTRIPAQLLSGIGFIGAGTILRDGFQVKGLTTAASLLAVTGIGLTIGAGAYGLGIMATVIVYLILSYTHIISQKAQKFTDFDFKIYTTNPNFEIKKIERIFSAEEITIEHIKKYDEYLEIKGKISESINKNELISKIIGITDVSEVIEEKNEI